MNKFFVLILLAGASYFPLPVDNGITGTFCEYRFSHLHAGFDFSTKGETGFPIKCFDNGDLVGIKVTKRGYGNVIYIKHSTKNIISVYGHLESFAPKIQKYVDNYKKKVKNKYPGEIPLSVFGNKKITFKKGEIIGFSGESGVGFPHLHFELRDLKNRPLNSVNYNLKLPKDNISPTIKWLYIYPANHKSTINGKNQKTKIKIYQTKNNKYIFKPVYLKGDFLLSLQCFDKANKGGKLGIAEIEFFVNKQLFYQFSPEIFSYNNYNQSVLVFDFSNTSLNPTLYTYNLFKLKGSSLLCQKGNGFFTQTGEKESNIIIRIKDFKGNISTLKGVVKTDKSNTVKLNKNYLPFFSKKTEDKIIFANKLTQQEKVTLKNKNCLFYINNFKNQINFYNCTVSITGFNKNKMLVQAEKLEVFPDWQLPDVKDTTIKISPENIFIKTISLKYQFKTVNKKAGIYRYDQFKNKWIFLKSNNNGKIIKGNSYRAGIYSVFIDNVKPEVKSNLFYRKNKTAIKITDIGMGIDDDKIFLINNKLKIKMEYDPDRKLAYTEKKLPKGIYKIKISDLAKNSFTKSVVLK
jgi:hypothetical protein